MNITRKLTKAKLLRKRTHNLRKNTSVQVASRFLIVTAGFWCLILQYLQEIFRFCWPEIINVYWQNRAQNGYLTSHQSSAKYDTTKTKYMTGLMDKAIGVAKVNENEPDWYENFFSTAYSVSKNNRLFSDCTFLLEIQI
jgi:hypothetical protein